MQFESVLLIALFDIAVTTAATGLTFGILFLAIYISKLLRERKQEEAYEDAND